MSSILKVNNIKDTADTILVKTNGSGAMDNDSLFSNNGSFKVHTNQDQVVPNNTWTTITFNQQSFSNGCDINANKIDNFTHGGRYFVYCIVTPKTELTGALGNAVMGEMAVARNGGKLFYQRGYIGYKSSLTIQAIVSLSLSHNLTFQFKQQSGADLTLDSSSNNVVAIGFRLISK